MFKLMLVVGGWSNSCEIVHEWKSLDLTDDKPTSVQVMAWCRQATNHHRTNVYIELYHHTALTDYKTTSVQVMAWCRQVTNHHQANVYLEFYHPTASLHQQRVKDSVAVYFPSRSQMLSHNFLSFYDIKFRLSVVLVKQYYHLFYY